mgnify:CR=1 FL=1
MIRNKAQVQEYLLNKLKKSSPDIIESAIVSSDGLVLVSTAKETEYKEKISAFAASIYKPSEKAASDLLLSSISFILVSGNERTIYIKEISKNLLLAIIAKRDSKWDKIQAEIGTTVADLKNIEQIKGNL